MSASYSRLLNIINDFIIFWFNKEFFAIGFTSFIGVGVRVILSDIFSVSNGSNDDSTSYHPFFEIFYSQTYLLPNLIGCFFMAILVYDRVRLPITNISLALYKSFTTGFCGSLTTFSSWLNGAVSSSFNKTFYGVFVMLLLEIWLMWGAFTFGFAAVKFVEGFFVFEVTDNDKKPETVSSGSPNIIYKNSNPNSDFTVRRSSVVRSTLLIDDLRSDFDNENDLLDHVELNLISTRISVFRENIFVQEKSPTVINRRQSTRLKDESAVVQTENSSQSLSIDFNSNQTPSKSILTISLENLIAFFRVYELQIWMVLFFVSALTVWISGAFEDRTNSTSVLFLKSLIFAPFGSWLRWSLTRFPQLKAWWPDMNLQTMLANFIATALLCFLVVFADSWQWTFPINEGFNGSLSTVSTFFAELHTLYYEKGPGRSFRYGLATVIGSIILIQLIRA